MKDTKKYIRDKDYLRYYANNDGDGIWTIQHNELADGKIEVNPEWEVLEENIGRIYVVKPKKKEEVKEIKKMESKYYKPTIEEFHVGFELEIFTDDKWSTTTFNTEDIIPAFARVDSKTLVSDNIRVKYLDRDDILSFGFELDKVHEGKEQELFYKGNVVLYCRYDEHIVGMFTRDPAKSDVFSRFNVDPNKVQGLIIRNKSELKKFLQQSKIL